MHFITKRDTLMSLFGWDRRLATLAIRLYNGVDTFEDIERTPNFDGKPLLSTDEEKTIKYFLIEK